MKATILGAGAWGTAIAALCARANIYETILWGRNPIILDQITKTYQHCDALPNINLPKNIICEPNLTKATTDADIIFCAIPTQKMRAFLQTLPNLSPDVIFVNCSKGLEQEQLKLPCQIIADFHQGICLTLSGPNFATEIAQSLPAASVIAGNKKHKNAIEKTLLALQSKQFRPYYHFDQIGLEAACIIKNIIAIAAGISMALQLGENARTALITRSINEMILFSKSLGGIRETVYGLGGIGDLMLTCSSLKSRNTFFGYQLGLGKIDLDAFIQHGNTGGKNC